MNGRTTVAVAGATGFVGRYVVHELVARGHTVRALSRDRQHARRILAEVPAGAVRVVAGSLDSAEAVAELLDGAEACVNAVGILRETRGRTFRKVHVEGTRRLVEAAASAGARRFVQVSALGVSDEGRTPYQRTKFEAEQIVQASGLDWTIFRPSLVHGPESDFMWMVAGWVRGERAPWYFLPYFRRREPGEDVAPLAPVRYVDPLVQPVAVQDVAWAIAESLARPEAIGEVYNLTGPETLSWPELLRAIRDAIPGAWKVEPVGLSADKAVGLAKAAKALGVGSLLPFDEGMAIMGSMDSVAEPIKAEVHLGFRPRPFTPALRQYARQL